jgi:metallo-beta-lactamase family protein
VKLSFHGAAGTVTGARFLVEAGPVSMCLDCGLFQGERALRQRNWEPPPFDPGHLASVVLSHAHIDHSGYLPRLARDGFTGPVFCSPATGDLLRIMLPDAARLQEEEAAYRNRTGATRYAPALPLFTADDAERALALLRPTPFGRRFEAASGITARLLASGHILGASIVEVEGDGRRLVYSGDLGRYGVPVMRDPEPVRTADVVLVESTYGNRRHPEDDGRPAITAAVRRAVDRGGVLLIPAFAVGRTQDVLYLIRELEDQGRIPALAVYLDSPMAIAATAVYAQHPEEHDADTARLSAAGRRPFVPARFHLASTAEQSKRLNALDGPAIIVAGSGMATGGRILHHLRQRLPDERTTVLFVGYQAAGTRGRTLRDGAPTVRIFGEDVPVRATVVATDALSAHGDQGDLLQWLGGFRPPPSATFVVHGEPEAAAALRDAVLHELRWTRCEVAAHGQTIAV